MGLAGAAQAGDLTLVSDSMNTNYTAQITGPASPFTGGGLDVYEGPITFQVTQGGKPATITAFCVDLFDDIGLGGLNLNYETSPLGTTRDTDGQHLGTTLSGGTLTEIDKLLTLASSLETNMNGNAADLAAIQGAIWEVENPGYTVASHNGGIDALTAQFVAEAAITNPGAAGYLPIGGMETIISKGSDNQAFAFAVPGGVPEPATWTIMIMGFGAMGAALRRRRATAAFA
ncbi:MAG: PEP-CTERM sorting domain-containing protein [Phenylobacterium sp.]|nr:MAG: PEP-CTERM sorting domain-containing protein [Phenylobacterium sp.]